MIPILYDSYEVAFESNGLGRLADCTRCIVTEERNGIYECEFDYPISGEMYSEITEGRIITVTHDDGHDVQPFDIYAHSAPLDGVVTFFAHHISYRLNNIILKPYTASTCAAALAGMATNTYNTNPFTFWTDKSVSAQWSNDVPTAVKAALAGQQGSILDVYGKGEYLYDKWTVRLYVNRGNDNGVAIRYGVNLMDMRQERDDTGMHTAVAPFWRSAEDGTTVMLPEGIIISSLVPLMSEPWVTGDGEVMTDGDGEPIIFDSPTIIPVPMDLSDAFETKPTVAELRAEALRRLDNSQAWLPEDNITVEFVDLANTEDYKDVAALQRVRLCDRVSVYCGPLGVSAVSMQVIKVVYDVLAEQYAQIELGSPRSTYAQTLMETVDSAIGAATADLASVSQLQQAVDSATNQITGATNSHVKFIYDANGGLQEILVMDTDDINTAVNVWRFNSGGLGHSSNGYAGPYSVAMTQDGAIVADMITTGSLNADLIKTGVLDGELIKAKLLQIIDAKNAVIASFDDTIRLGQLLQGRAEIDHNSFILYDKDDTEYLDVGDLRGVDGVALATFHYFGDGVTTNYYVRFDYSKTQITGVTVNGTATQDYTSNGYDGASGKGIRVQLGTAPTDGAQISISVRTTVPVYHYDFGRRKTGSQYGMYSCVEGQDSTASGNYSHAEGLDCTASGESSHAEGYSATASGDYSHAEGESSSIGEYSHAEGGGTASGNYSHAEGHGTASGASSHAEGYGHANGAQSHAEGMSTAADGRFSHAEGYSATASGDYSHAEGESSSIGEYSHAEGHGNEASGNESHVEGLYCKAIGRCSHTEGMGCTATHLAQHVFGQYNALDASTNDGSVRGTYVEIVGKGANNSSRSNARTLDWVGNEWIAGTLTQASDARLKREVGDVPDVSSIRARRFRWAGDGRDDREHVGYYAQDVEAIMPDLVGEDASGYKSLDYIGLLCAKVEFLERRVTGLERRVSINAKD